MGGRDWDRDWDGTWDGGWDGRDRRESMATATATTTTIGRAVFVRTTSATVTRATCARRAACAVVRPRRRSTRAVAAMASVGGGAPASAGNAYVLLTLEYVDGMVEKRGPYREEHLAGAQRGFDEGKIVMAGALTDPVDAGVFVFKNCTKEEVEAFVKADAYYKAGLIPGYSIRPWMVVVGN